MRFLKRFLVLLAVLSITACDDTDFEATWQDPSTPPLDLRTESIAAFLLSANEAARRSFEYNLASQFNKLGLEATPGYELLSETDVTDKEQVLADLARTGVDHAIFMRIIDREQEVSYIPGSVWYPGFSYDPFFWRDGAFVGPWGFGGPWPTYYDSGYYLVNTIVSVETLVYSVPNSKLLWSGLSRTMNPSKVDDFVEDLVAAVVKEMRKTGLVPRAASFVSGFALG